MSERIYLGEVLGVDGRYYRAIFQGDTINKISETSTFTNPAHTIVNDEEYIYVGFAGSNPVRKYRVDDLSLVGTSVIMPTTVFALALDGQKLYVAIGNGSASTIKALNKDDLSILQEISIKSYSINDMVLDDNYIYVNNGLVTRKYLKADLTLLASSPNVNSSRNIGVDDDFIYVTGVNKLTKLNKSDLSVALSNTAITADFHGAALDDIFLYTVSGSGLLYKLNKADLTAVKNTNVKVSTTFTVSGKAIILNDGHLYLTTASKLQEVECGNLSLVREYTGYGTESSTILRAVALVDSFMFIGGMAPNIIQKVSNYHKIVGYRKGK